MDYIEGDVTRHFPITIESLNQKNNQKFKNWTSCEQLTVQSIQDK